MISIIIPTRNEEKIIGKTLRCLRRYSGPHELIVADDGSVDKTIPQAKVLADQVVELHTQVHRTIAIGRNAGAAAARGDFFVFVDADIFLLDPNEFFARALQNFRDDPKLVALTGAIRVLPEFATFSDRLVFGGLNWLHRILNNWFGRGAAAGEFQMIRAVAFKALGGYNPKLVANEDYDLFRRLRQIGKTRFDGQLIIYHTGRRAHQVGWPKLLWLWFLNLTSVSIFGRALSKEWQEIR